MFMSVSWTHKVHFHLRAFTCGPSAAWRVHCTYIQCSSYISHLQCQFLTKSSLMIHPKLATIQPLSWTCVWFSSKHVSLAHMFTCLLSDSTILSFLNIYFLSANILTILPTAIVFVPRRVLLSLQAGPLLLQKELKYYLCGYTVVGKKWLGMSLIEVRVFRKLWAIEEFVLCPKRSWQSLKCLNQGSNIFPTWILDF